MMRKKQKKNKKGKQGGEDFLDGEDPGAADGQQGMEDKAPVEASIDDEFALPEKKGKGKAAAGAKKKDGLAPPNHPTPTATASAPVTSAGCNQRAAADGVEHRSSSRAGGMIP